MADDDAAVGEAVVVGGQGGAFLIVHFAEGGEGYGGVVGGMAVSVGEVGEAVFVVGEVNVDVGGKHLQGFNSVVAAGVVDGGGVESAGVEPFDDGGEAVGIVRRGDEADDILGLGEQAGYLVHDGIDADKAWSRAAGADLVILAVDALEVAVGEKDVADAFVATQRRLLATMDANSGGFGHMSGTAKAKCFSAVGGALVWTEGAFHGAKIRFFCEK